MIGLTKAQRRSLEAGQRKSTPIGEAIRNARIAKGLSAEDLAREVSAIVEERPPLTRQAICEWEHGRNRPARKRIAAVEHVLGIEVPR